MKKDLSGTPDNFSKNIRTIINFHKKYQMKKENQDWTKNTLINEESLICKCGKELDIIHCSNWHDGTGVFYAQCECGNSTNIRWRSKDSNGNSHGDSNGNSKNSNGNSNDKSVSLNELKQYFREHYPHIDNEMSDIELAIWITNHRGIYSIPRLADLLADYLLANGAYAQE